MLKRNKKIEASIDSAFKQMMIANAAEPYIHEEYSRCERIWKAWIAIYTKGNLDQAYALEQAFHDSNENMEWYMGKYGIDWLCENFRRFGFHSEDI